MLNAVAPVVIQQKKHLYLNTDNEPSKGHIKVLDMTSEKCGLLKLNARGSVIQVPIRTLVELPQSSAFMKNIEDCFGLPLVDLQSNDTNKVDSVYIDSNPLYVHDILNYLKTGVLHFSHQCPLRIIMEELEYWGLKEEDLSMCCTHRITDERERQSSYKKIVAQYEAFGRSPPLWCVPYNKSKKYKIWKFLEHPSTLGSKVWFSFMIFVLGLSLLAIFAETYPMFRVPDYNVVVARSNLTIETGLQLFYYIVSYKIQWLIIVDVIFAIILTIELVVRFTVSPNKRRFLLSPFTFADIIGNFITPLVLVISFFTLNTQESKHVLFYISLGRLFRLYRLPEKMANYANIKIMLLTIKASLTDIVLLTLLYFTAAFLNGLIIFYVEMEYGTYKTLFEALWYAVVTMTTVGYGDFYPVSSLGYLFALFCIMQGVILTGMVTTIIINQFMTVHTEIQKYNRVKRP